MNTDDFAKKYLTIDWETADRIAVGVLLDAYNTATTYNETSQHPEDIAYNKDLIPALKRVLDYFGEKV